VFTLVSLTFKQDNEDELTVEDCAETVANYLMDEEKIDNVEYSETSGGFKIHLEIKKYPEDVAKVLRRCSREMVTTFGRAKSRVRFISSKLLDPVTIQKLKDLLQTLHSWREDELQDLRENRLDYAEQFWAYANSNQDKEYTSSSLSDAGSKGMIFKNKASWAECGYRFPLGFPLTIDIAKESKNQNQWIMIYSTIR
jgi:hypothetical protein